MRPVVDKGVIPVERMLPVVRRADRPPQTAAIDVVFTLICVAERHSIILGGLPIAASCKEQIIERRRRETGHDATGCEIAHTSDNYPVLITILERSEKPRAVTLDRAAGRYRILLAVKGWPAFRLHQGPVERRQHR